MAEGIQQHIVGALGVVMMFGIPWYLKAHPSVSASSSPEDRQEFVSTYRQNFKQACLQSAPSASCECAAQYVGE